MMRPPSLGSLPSQVETTPPARSTMGIEGQDVEWLQAAFDHEVDVTQRQQAIIVAVAAEAPEAHGAA